MPRSSAPPPPRDTGPASGAGASCLHHAFQGWAARAPERVALVHGTERVTYGELHARSARLAARLRALGVGPEVCVGVCTGRGPEMVAAVLGVLAAGGAYVPLDPKYPRERLDFVLRDADVRVLVTESRLRDRLPEFGGEAVLVDHVGEGSDALHGKAGAVLPENLAYLIYTSGSTGRPKGVQVEHRSAVALLDWAAGVFADGLLGGVLAATSLAFDLSVFELFLPLGRGGTVVLADDALALATLPARDAVTLLNTVPSAAAALARAGAIPPSVRTVCLAGEALKRGLADELYALPHVEAVYNLYGPSEDTTYSTWSLVPRHEERAPAIGRPVAGTAACVLDAGMEPVRDGESGELYLGGAGLARGYLGRPDATAERFVPDPFGGEPGARLYRTGDSVRARADGELEFLGRLDHQVKLRGFRIELGEIEAVLAEAPGVRDAVVLLREDTPGDPRLAAYLVPREPGALSVEQARDFVRARLPEPMVPGAWVVLDALPLTPNGKTDRAALPAPAGSGSTSEHVAPRTPTERALAGIWAEVLGVDSPGAADDFLELGGHSLLAMRVVARVRDSLGAELPLGAVLEARTLAALAERVDAAAPPAEVPAPRRGADGEPAPLSFSQQRLWLLDRLDPGSPVYNVPAVVRLSGALDRDALRRALEEIVLRHDALRTTIQVRDGEPVQLVGPAAAPLLLPVDDLAAAHPDERGGRLAELEREEARRSFDLARGPLFRARLARVADDEHALLLTMHHVVSDGWSLEVLFRELAALYAAFAAGRASPLSAPPLRFADLARVQRERITGQALASLLAYWVPRLRGAPPLDLPADRPRPARRGLAGATHRFAVPAETAARIAALGRTEGATPFMAMLAAFKLFLARHAGEWDVVVGSPIAGRTQRETEGVVGFFANTLALRTELGADVPFREALRRVRATTLGAYAHGDLPFEALVEAIGGERDPGRTPVFQVMFAVRDRLPGIEAGGVRMAMREGETGTAKFDLFLELTEGPDGVEAALEYAADLFDASTVERMAERFGTLLEGAAAEPDRPASALPLLPPAERERVVRAWNATDAPGPRGARLHDGFVASASRTPGAAALVHGERRVAYAELDAASARIARGLRARGIGPESRVGVMLERTPELVAALLGVLRAGAAYVPLDPAYPRERIDFIVRDAAVPLVVTQGSLAGGLAGQGAELLLVEELPMEDGGDPEGGAAAENAAYLIYTSGSTGTPKGVVIEHRSAAAFLEWARGEFAAAELAGVLASTSVCFDLSVFEIFVPLAAGTTVVLAENALELPRLPARDRVTLVNTVPSAAAELARAGAIPAGVRSVNLAGEPLKGALVEALYAAGVGIVRNLYGPSEDTTYSTWTAVPRGAGREPTIGRPLANTRAYVLDAGLEPAPVGVPGELYLAGAGLARGYLGRAGMTAERFVPDPFGGGGGRLYRTGDRARWLPAGELEFLGRLDHQVKLRGFRIEPGEIEVALLRHPAVREAVVVVREEAGGPRLVAYAGTGGAAAAAEELRAHLAGLLPAHMVPVDFVVLAALPKTPNGKTDRAALPAPAAAPAAEWTAPRTETEIELARIWAEALGVERVGADDHFFRLGGHSLLATRVLAAVWESFGVEVPLHRVFDAPTLAGMAATVDGEREAALAAMLAELDGITDDEARLLLATEGEQN
ncbi:MAG TPA: amino acid adenylation domain-containing protein [Longimicrobiaceae bacterium]